MLVLVANDLPPASRGRLKLWFVEIKSGVFVSGINKSTAEKVVSYLLELKWGAGALLLIAKSKSPGFDVISLGQTNRKIVNISRMPLIAKPLLI